MRFGSAGMVERRRISIDFTLPLGSRGGGLEGGVAACYQTSKFLGNLKNKGLSYVLDNLIPV